MSPLPDALKSALTLAVIAAVCTAMVAGTWRLTADRIAANESARLQESLAPALAGLDYDSDIAGARQVLEPPHGLPGRAPAAIYPVYRGDRPAAALFEVTAPDGYSGPIRLLVGIAADGRITAVRVLEHAETPGLGDLIEARRSDWIRQFDGRSLGQPVAGEWTIRADGGAFDQLTGASITPRAVIKAVRDTLLYFDAHRDEIFQRASAEDPQQQ